MNGKPTIGQAVAQIFGLNLKSYESPGGTTARRHPDEAMWLMDGLIVTAGANVGFDPGANWHMIPLHHDLV